MSELLPGFSESLLKMALDNKARAHTVRVEWLVDSFEDGVLKRRVLTNYAQILRQPFQRRRLDDGTWESLAEASKAALVRILRDAELTLWYGKPTRNLDGLPLSTCGGVLHYLKRRVYENDSVSLQELRPLTLFTKRGEHDEFLEEEMHTHELLWEFSLQVNPGHYQRGMKPAVLPPKRETYTVFPQGSRLTDGVAT